MKSMIYVDEAREVCKNHSRWRSIVSAYLHGTKAWVSILYIQADYVWYLRNQTSPKPRCQIQNSRSINPEASNAKILLHCYFTSWKIGNIICFSTRTKYWSKEHWRVIVPWTEQADWRKLLELNATRLVVELLSLIINEWLQYVIKV